MFIIDTDVISNLRKDKKHLGVQAWVERTGLDKLGTTVITVVEIQYSIESQQHSGMKRHRHSLVPYEDATQGWLDRFLGVVGLQIYPLTVKAGLLLRRMHETAGLKDFIVAGSKQKQPKTAADLAIAAIAITEGAILATGNHRHFEAIDAHFPLPGLYNPFEDSWSRKPAA